MNHKPLFHSAIIAAAMMTSAFAPSPALSAVQSVSGPLTAASANAAVEAFYVRRAEAKLWFRDARTIEAAAALPTILRRAPLEGLADGPRLAGQVEAAILSGRTGTPAAIAAAERVLSNAWVTYVQTIQTPTKGMIYGDPMVRPNVQRPDQILGLASIAPSLADHLNGVASVNPLYAALREAAVREAALPGGGMSDKLVSNLERARAIPAKGRFLVIDVPSARLTMYENGSPVDSMKVIVGMPAYPTPMIASMIHYTTFNPYWHVPDHLVRKTVAPNVIKQGAAYLKARGYEVVSEWSNSAAIIPASDVDWKGVVAGTAEVKVRQLPGGANSMGKMKFPFANGEGIYLHDTPNKELFAKSQRDLSNGCIRVEDAPRLARWLFRQEPAALTSKAPEQHVQLGSGVPVFVTYLTALPGNGELTINKDVYGLDRGTQSRVAALR
ncbi:MAG: L,D-transpeptidase family protein [Sphingomonas sp.]|nr:L,D-transpeptidase family protein [Sphingomonas sp.]